MLGKFTCERLVDAWIRAANNIDTQRTACEYNLGVAGSCLTVAPEIEWTLYICSGSSI